jgi:hypothetical protein
MTLEVTLTILSVSRLRLRIHQLITQPEENNSTLKSPTMMYPRSGLLRSRVSMKVCTSLTSSILLQVRLGSPMNFTPTIQHLNSKMLSTDISGKILGGQASQSKLNTLMKPVRFSTLQMELK